MINIVERDRRQSDQHCGERPQLGVFTVAECGVRASLDEEGLRKHWRRWGEPALCSLREEHPRQREESAGTL